MDEWIASFSLDGKLFATASGDSEAPSQLLIFDVPSAQLQVNSTLPNLGQMLGSFDSMFVVWSVDFIN
jgi:hypothetical protein